MNLGGWLNTEPVSMQIFGSYRLMLTVFLYLVYVSFLFTQQECLSLFRHLSVPALYQKYVNSSFAAVDEWTLSQAMAADTSAGGGISQLEQHYATFIVSFIP